MYIAVFDEECLNPENICSESCKLKRLGNRSSSPWWRCEFEELTSSFYPAITLDPGMDLAA